MINIGLVGHVAHGKSSLVKALTGINTVRFKKELERNITIKLGYADCYIYNENGEWKSTSKSEQKDSLGISFIDCPGHDAYVSTMISGTCVMDGVLLLVSANEKCPMPQTIEHLKIIKILGIKNIIVIQNKIDLVSRYEAIQNYKEIREFLKNDEIPIIPICASRGLGISEVCKKIYEDFFLKKKNEEFFLKKKNEEFFLKSPINEMIIIRSFDINKPGSVIEEIQGGIVGGSIIQGSLSKGSKIEITPGIIYKTSESFMYSPIIANITSINISSNEVNTAFKGGLIGVGLDIDPSLTKNNNLVGQIITDLNNGPDVYSKILIKCEEKISFSKKELILVNSGAFQTEGIVRSSSENKIKIKVTIPIPSKLESNIIISKKINNGWRLYCHGKLIDGEKIMKKN